MHQTLSDITHARIARANAIRDAGGMEPALASGALPARADITLSEAIVLGLLRQGVTRFIGVLGHGSTEVGEVLRIYEAAGLVRTCGVRNEIEATHAATALRWVTGEKAAVIASIGPGPLQALAAAIVPASDGIGVWFLFGDETTEDEGPNMQQIPKHEQHSFLNICSAMGEAYCLHTPASVTVALRRGMNVVAHPFRAGPFFLLMPMNTQPKIIPRFNLHELPAGAPPRLGPASDDGAFARAVEAIRAADRVVVKVGGGARNAEAPLLEFLELGNAIAVLTPLATGAIPYDHVRNMTVGGSKGSLSGNYAMEEADLLVAIGTRFVCQSDCSRTGYPNVQQVININADLHAAMHYNKTIPLIGDVALTLDLLNERLRSVPHSRGDSRWLEACYQKREEWIAFKSERYATPCLDDDVWGRPVLTQPAAIKTASDWARQHNIVSFFDAGDVQANGFAIVEDSRPGQTFTESGASYMGFAVSALLATGLATKPFYGLAFTGDGSFTMNPQILIDGVMHGARGCIMLLDNRRMAAISGLQATQFDAIYATSDTVEVDYAAWANAVKGVQGLHGGHSTQELLAALERARAYDGLSLIHVPVYFGPDPLGGMGVFGRWNVGNWCEDTQALRHDIGL